MTPSAGPWATDGLARRRGTSSSASRISSRVTLGLVLIPRARATCSSEHDATWTHKPAIRPSEYGRGAVGPAANQPAEPWLSRHRRYP